MNNSANYDQNSSVCIVLNFLIHEIVIILSMNYSQVSHNNLIFFFSFHQLKVELLQLTNLLPLICYKAMLIIFREF